MTFIWRHPSKAGEGRFPEKPGIFKIGTTVNGVYSRQIEEFDYSRQSRWEKTTANKVKKTGAYILRFFV
jgi:hypothetical protein